MSSTLTIPVSIPSPSSTNTSASSPIPPTTPLTPNSGHHVSFAQPLHGTAVDQFSFGALNLDTNPAPTTASNATTTNGGPVRRKPSRRANTAERRATHNAVERQRRETLNSRFLDLAAQLPNLASVRRPSKSAIVNSSIALIHSARRSRATAARELRALKAEADALRAEANKWRDRAAMGLAQIEEPVRSRDFDELVNGVPEESEEGLIEQERRAFEIVKEGLRQDASSTAGYMQSDLATDSFCNYGFDEDEDDSSDSQGRSTRRPSSQGSVHSQPAVARSNTLTVDPLIVDPSAALLQAHPTHQGGIDVFGGYDFTTQSLGHAAVIASKTAANQWQPNLFTPQQAFSHPSFLGGFGLRSDDETSSNSDVGSVVGFDLNQVNIVHPVLAQHRSRASLGNLNTVGLSTPPMSAPTAVSPYPESGSAGDAFAAAYGVAFPSAVPARIAGGGNTYGAAMGLYM